MAGSFLCSEGPRNPACIQNSVLGGGLVSREREGVQRGVEDEVEGVAYAEKGEEG